MTPPNIPDTIWMVTETDPDGETQGSRYSQDIGGDWNDNQPREFRATPRGKTAVKVETLREEMGKLIRVVRHVFGEAEQQVGMELTEITLSVEVSGEDPLVFWAVAARRRPREQLTSNSIESSHSWLIDGDNTQGTAQLHHLRWQAPISGLARCPT